MNTLKSLLLTLALTGSIASAQSETYNIKGKNPDGSTYGGTISFNCDAEAVVCPVSWSNGETGIAMANMGMAAAYGDDETYGLAMYVYSSADGTMSGAWAMAANTDVVSNETIQGFSPETVAGTYNIEGTNPDGSTYKGTLSLKRLNGYFSVVWNVGGELTKGIGIYRNGVLGIAFGPGANFGIAVYEAAEDRTFNGNWIGSGGTAVGSETLIIK